MTSIKQNIKTFLLILLAGSISAWGIRQIIVSAAPPMNFETVTLVDDGLTASTAFDIAPDGRIFILQQDGTVRIYKNGALLPHFFDQLPAWATGDNGLLGIAFDPDWSSNQYVYFYYVDEEDHTHRVVRFDSSGDIGTNGPIEIYNSHVPAGFNHAGGTITFGPDGKLYIGIGDAGQSTNAADLSVPMGKILRINKDGSMPTDNPFVGTAGARPEIWAYGFRNPFRFQFDSATGKLYVGDVGESTWEEINLVTKGGDYGWPKAEGVCASCSSINPMYVYAHDTPGFAVVGGPVYHGSMFPAEYQNKLFFADYGKGFIKTLAINADGTAGSAQDFEMAGGSVVDMKVGPDGSLYYMTIYPGKLYQTSYTIGNKAPKSVAHADTASGPAPLTVHFTNASTDPESSPLTFAWDFGDGSTSTEANPIKTYSAKGVFTARLVTSDGDRSATSTPIAISVGTPPTITVASPAESSTYKAGDTIVYSASATDESGASLPASAFSREVLLHHNIHVHPFLRPTAVTNDTFAIPRTGEASADSWYEIRVTATDSRGLSSEKSVNIFPQKSDLSFASSPAGLSIELDGQPLATPGSVVGVVGFERSITGPSVQQTASGIYEFDHWSDGGAETHTITTPADDTTYTAYFRQGTPFVGQYYPNKDLSGEPAFSRNDPKIDFDWGGGSPDPKLPIDAFSARWVKQQFFSGGTYEFTAASDDGKRLFIDGNKIIDNWQDQGTVVRTATVDLPRGEHEIKMEYYESSGGAVAKLAWKFVPGSATSTPIGTTTPPVTGTSTPPTGTTTPPTGTSTPPVTGTSTPPVTSTTTPPVTGTSTPPVTGTTTPPVTGTSTPSSDEYSAEYFDNITLSGTPVLTRTDHLVNFDWGMSSPGPGVPSDLYSARWTKDQEFSAGLYRFTVTSDDGVRLYVDDQLIIDKWFDHPSIAYSVNKVLSQGTHAIRIEYFERYGGAVMKFSAVQQASTPAAGEDANYHVEYFGNPDLSGSPVISEEEADLNHIWGYGSPAPTVPREGFSARWTKHRMYQSGTHKFTLKADDGVRFYVDGNLLVDDWGDHPMRTYTPTITLSAGIHELRVEYYERKGSAVMTLNAP